MRLELGDGDTLSVSESASASNSAHIEAQVLKDESARLLAVFEDAKDPNEATFDFTIPEGYVAEKRADGGIDVVAGEELQNRLEDAGVRGNFVLASIDSPWAIDAEGQDVPTSFELDDGQLLQTVSPEANTEYPVVADPRIEWKGYYAELYYDEAETLDMRDSDVVIAGMLATSAAIAVLPGGAPVAAAMAAIAAGSVAIITTTATNAVSDGRCLKVDVPSMFASTVPC